ncbi:MAG: hypothetical protein AAF902_02280 [Chloroflexota bacterium]
MNRKYIYLWTAIVVCLCVFVFIQDLGASRLAFEGSESSCKGLVQEAETGSLFGAMQVGTHHDASNGKFIVTPKTIVNSETFENNADRAEFCVEIPQDGLYQIKAWAQADGSLHDSFFVAINNYPATGYLWDVVSAGDFTENLVNDRGKSDPQTIFLPAGQLTLTFANRESGTRLDRFEVVRVDDGQSTADPIGKCGNLEQEAEDAILFGNAKIGADNRASRGSYVFIDPIEGKSLDQIDQVNRAEFCITIAEAGRYQIFAQVQARDSESDSFYVRVNGSPAAGYVWDFSHHNEFIEYLVHDRDKSDPITVYLDQGEHLIAFHNRESGAKLDRIKLILVEAENAQMPERPTSQTPTPTPSAPIPTISLPDRCGGLQQEAETAKLYGNFIVGASEYASGGQFIFVPRESSPSIAAINQAHRADFCVRVTESGRYRIIGRTSAMDAETNSFFVAVNGIPNQGILWDVRSEDKFVNGEVQDRGNPDAHVVELTAGQHTISFYLRETDAKLDRISLVQFKDSDASDQVPTQTPVPPAVTPQPTEVPPNPPPSFGGGAAVCGGLEQEAERAKLVGNMTIGFDGSASGGRYIYTPQSVPFASTPDDTQKADFCVQIFQPGNYQIEALVLAPNGKADSFFVTINDGETGSFLWDVENSSEFIADIVNDRGKADPAVFSLPAGHHTISVHHREAGVQLDKIKLQLVTNTDPD